MHIHTFSSDAPPAAWFPDPRHETGVQMLPCFFLLARPTGSAAACFGYLLAAEDQTESVIVVERATGHSSLVTVFPVPCVSCSSLRITSAAR